MKFIKSSVHEVQNNDICKKIELIGRTCYKSESRITDTSAQKFINGLIKRHHFAMLEHGELTFKLVDIDVSELLYIPYVRGYGYDSNGDRPSKYLVTVSLSHLYNPIWADNDSIQTLKKVYEYYYSGKDTSFKLDGTILLLQSESDIISEIGELANDMQCDPYEIWKHIASRTFKFVCDRGVSHELVRHRCSFAQESTRYCNYSLAKFDNEITFIKPSTFDTWSDCAKDTFMHAISAAEHSYMRMIESELKPEQARSILPNAVKTEVVMTAPIYQWYHFFDLRSKGTTGSPHPDMKEVADIAYSIFEGREEAIKIRLNIATKRFATSDN